MASRAEQFYDWCVLHDACYRGLKDITGKTFERWWKTTRKGQYCLWLALEWNYRSSAKRSRMERELGFAVWLEKPMSPAQKSQAANWLRANVKPPKFLPYQKVRKTK